MIRRPERLRCLSEHLPPGTLTLGAQSVGCEKDPEGATFRFKDGGSERACVVVAGGRRAQFATVAPPFAGYQYLRALIP